MTRSATNKLLVAFHAVVLAAIFLRIDYFPLTWVPMYSQFHGIEDLTLPVGDMPRMKRGYLVTTASGTTGFVGPKELNMPNANFRRIYYERSYGVGPPKYRRERASLNPLSNWLYDQLYPDPDPDTYAGEFHVNWDTDSTSATFWFESFAADGENFTAESAITYQLDFFGDGSFSEDVNPTQLDIGDSATMTATHWLLTSTAKGRLRKFTCTGASTDSPDLLPFSGVTIKVTRKQPL